MIIDPDFLDHWKTRMLVDLLDDDQTAPQYIMRLWAHCQLRRQWVFDNLPSVALKALCRYSGHPNKLEASLVTSGWVRRDDAGILTAVDWEIYNASLVASWGNGNRGGRPPKGNPLKTHGLPTGNPALTHGEPIREERSREDTKPKPPPAADALAGFDEFWDAYPSKVGKKAATKAWVKFRCSTMARQVIDSAKAWARSPGWLKNNGEYVPNPATWLNGERWNDLFPGHAPAAPADPRKAEAIAWLRANPTEARAMIDALRKRSPFYDTCEDAAIVSSPPRDVIDEVHTAMASTPTPEAP